MNLQRLPSRYPWLPWALLAAGVVASVVTFSIAHQRSENEANAAFVIRASETVNDIEQRMHIYTNVLYALRGLFRSSDKVTAREFQKFVRGIAIHERYPGLTNVSYAHFVRGPEKPGFEAAIEAEFEGLYPKLPPFRIKPREERAEYHVLTYVEPLAPNLVAWGLDLANDPERRVAVERARDTGGVAVTPGIALLRDSANQVVSVLLRLAVYRGDHLPESVEGRRQQYEGLVGVAIRFNEMMAKVMDHSGSETLRIEILETQATSPASAAAPGRRLFDSNDLQGNANSGESDPMLARYVFAAPITVGDRQWLVRITPRTDPGSISGKLLPYAVALLILALSTSVFLTARLLAHAHASAMRDTLTGLYNRNYMHEWFALELKRAARARQAISAVMVDIDHFKRFNDTWGHQAGDHVLQQLAALLMRLARGSDVACRYGGEEFLLLMPGASTAIARERAEQIRAEASSMKLKYAGRDLDSMTISAGIATYPDHAGDVPELLRRADEALYEAKGQGRNRVIQAGTADQPVPAP